MAVTYKLFDELLKNKRQSDILAPGASAPANSPDAETPGANLPSASMGNTSGFAGNNAPQKIQDASIIKGNAAGAYFNEANKKALSQGITSNISSKIKTASDDLQKQADEYGKYINTFADADKVDEELKQKALSGDVAAQDNIKGILGKQFNANQFSYNQAPIENIAALSDPLSRQQMLAKEAQQQTGGRYTKGMSRLDNALLDASNIDYEPIMKENQNLQKRVNEVKAANQQAYESEAKQLRDQQEVSKKLIQDEKGNIQSRAKAAYSADKAQFDKEISDIQKAKIQEDIIAFDRDASTTWERLQQVIQNGSQAQKLAAKAKQDELVNRRKAILAGNYLTKNTFDRNEADYITDKDVAANDIINKLLGIQENPLAVGRGTLKANITSNRGQALSDIVNWADLNPASGVRAPIGDGSVQGSPMDEAGSNVGNVASSGWDAILNAPANIASGAGNVVGSVLGDTAGNTVTEVLNPFGVFGGSDNDGVYGGQASDAGGAGSVSTAGLQKIGTKPLASIEMKTAPAAEGSILSVTEQNTNYTPSLVAAIKQFNPDLYRRLVLSGKVKG